MLPVLYGMAKNGKVKQWSVITEGSDVVIESGYKDGKKIISRTTSKPKNVGKKNATTPEQQALLEAQSKWNKQIDSGYIEDILQLGTVDKTLPMLANDYTETGHQILYPCFGQPKLDGVRAIADIDGDVVTLTSRGGKQYPVPELIRLGLLSLSKKLMIFKFDGEVYLHGLSLQRTVSSIRVNNENTDSLFFNIFDIPSELPFRERKKFLDIVDNTIKFFNIPRLKVVETITINSEDQARSYLSFYEEEGYEGLMLRNEEGIYEYNHRSNDLQKWKNMLDAEALVLDVEEDDLKQGVLVCRDYNSGLVFRCKMKGNSSYRSYENQLNLINKTIKYKYQQHTDDGYPQFPVGLCEREVDKNGKPLE